MRNVAVEKVLTSAESADIAIAGAVTIYTKAFILGDCDFFSISYTAVSATAAIDLKIELEESFQLPATEGSADTYWKVPESMSDIESAFATESTIRHKALAPIAMKYGRFKVTGAAGNGADAILNMWLNKQWMS